MFVGHLAVSLAAKSFDSYPWSHSLLMAIVWGVATGSLMYWASKRLRMAVVVGMVVLSHWLFDFATPTADLPLWPGGPKHGMGLWNSIPATMIVEGGLFIAAVATYIRVSNSRDAIGKWAFWALVVLTGGIWITQPWSPPPPGSGAVATVALAMFAFPLWAAWIDRHRSTESAT